MNKLIAKHDPGRRIADNRSSFNWLGAGWCAACQSDFTPLTGLTGEGGWPFGQDLAVSTPKATSIPFVELAFTGPGFR